MSSNATFVRLTRSIHSRGVAILMALIVLIGAWMCYATGDFTVISGDCGCIFPSANGWIPWPAVDLAVNLGIICAICAAMITLNRVYNILRSMTMVYVTFFLAMQMGTPELLVQFFSGPLVALVTMGCAVVLFSTYKRPVSSTRRVFLIFFLLSLGATVQYCYMLLIPVFLLGCVQMRVFRPRGMVAALLGLVTPWWIILGFGIVRPSDIHPPQFHSIFTEFAPEDAVLLLVSVGLTVFIALSGMVLNILRTIAYNARTRAYNGFLNILTLVTVMGLCLDYTNLVSYVPLLDCCAAFQAAHYFGPRRFERSWMLILGIILAYIVLYICHALL